jgi:Uma2 family endonuclease
MRSDEFPEDGRICYLGDEVWVDMSKEQIFSHNQVKSEYNVVLGSLVERERRGRYFPDGVPITNLDANLASQPDGVFVSIASLKSGKVRLIEGIEGGYVELEGAPDMALEVISTSSVEKDKTILLESYWCAGIGEYWLVDARDDKLNFDILRHAPSGYVKTRKRSAWLESNVFEKSFRLVGAKDALGHPEFTLEMG